MIGETRGRQSRRGQRLEDGGYHSCVLIYNKLRIVFQEFGLLRVLPAVNRKYQSQSGDQGVEMVSDHRGDDSMMTLPPGHGAQVQHPLMWTPPLVSVRSQELT